MKRQLIALALALTVAGTLTACGDSGTDMQDHNSAAGSGSTAGQASSRRTSAAQRNADGFMQDGHYAADQDGRVNGSTGQDLGRDGRDMMRDTGDAVGDVGRGVGNAVGDVTRGVGDAVQDIGSGVNRAAREY